MGSRPHKRAKHEDIPIRTHYNPLPMTARAHYEDLMEEARTCITHGNYKDLIHTVLPKLRKLCVHFVVYNRSINEFLNDAAIPGDEYQDVSTHINLQSILTRRLLQEKVQCSICLSTPSHGVITGCTHVFCQKCIRKWFTRGKTSLDLVMDPTAKDPTNCPYCRELLTLNDMFSETKPTTKLEILMQLLREDTSNSKSEFENIDGPVVLLVDFETSRRHRVTVNAACRVFLLDACRKSIEEELVARVTQPLCVLRLISQNTIEDKILSLKETFAQTDTFDFNGKEILRYILQEDSM
uniref:Zinc finger, RING-type n=1 Tax=Medicago truncatula TaxID=3880 RepID=Q1RU59_MEDTR|nr:Zinc finger, RING-type [Medicago truncatula]